MHFTKQELEAMTEIELFARILHAEAGNQSERGQMMVAQVVMNRLNRPLRFRDSIKGILLTPFQFECIDRGIERVPLYKLKDEIGIVVTAMLHQLPNGVAKMKADHYYNPKLCNPEPKWASIYPLEVIEGAHNFHIELMRMV